MPGQPSSRRVSTRWAKTLRLAAVVGGMLVGALAPVSSAVAAATPMVDLGTASTYAVLSGASVGNTVNAPTAAHTTLRGDLGVLAAEQPTGFPPGIVTGSKQVGNAAAAAAHADLVEAYVEVAERTGGTTLAGALAGATVLPGLHTIVGAASNTTTVTLDARGDPNAVFVFQVGGALAFAAGSHVALVNGAQASRVFWQVNGAGAVGADADFMGTLMAIDAVAIGANTLVNGRAFARNGALTLNANEFYSSPPTVTITGEPIAYTADSTPTISGTTDVEGPVRVTFAGQILTATPDADGAWSVTSAIRENGTYAVAALVTDGAGNQGSAGQQLTIDTLPPEIALDDGSSVMTNDATPTIAGTTNAAVGTIVRVTVDAQNLRALVHAGGTWNIRTAALADGSRTVTAAVSDLAGNESTASQELTVDTTAPAATIAGGVSDLTNDATPNIAGTAGVESGTIVTVTLADETLTATVGDGGAWSVTAAALSDGPHRVVMAVSDAAGNPAGFSQTLTVDTVSPVVAISGGATATTNDVDPTIVGSSDAAPGTTVSVSIAGQTMTTLVQANGTWNATPTFVGTGTWTVGASAPDPAGNVGSATQTLTIAPTAPTSGAGEAPVAPSPDPAPSVTPAPAVPVAPAAPPTRTGAITVAATATVAPAVRQRVRGLTLSIRTKVTAPASGRIVATANGTVKIKGIARSIRLTTAIARIAAGTSKTLRLKPKGSTLVARTAVDKIKRAVARGTTVTARITIKIVDAAGHARYVKRTVKLTK